MGRVVVVMDLTRVDLPALASYLVGIPQARTSLVSGVGLTVRKLTPSGKASPALRADIFEDFVEYLFLEILF